MVAKIHNYFIISKEMKKNISCKAGIDGKGHRPKGKVKRDLWFYRVGRKRQRTQSFYAANMMRSSL